MNNFDIRFAALETKCSQLDDKNTYYQNRIQLLLSENTFLKDNLKLVEENNTLLSEEVSQLKIDYSNLIDKNHQFENIFLEFREKLSSLEFEQT